MSASELTRTAYQTLFDATFSVLERTYWLFATPPSWLILRS